MFFFIILAPGRGVVGLVYDATAVIVSGWIADSVASLSVHVLDNRLV